MQPSKEFELKVKYFQSQNYTPQDVVRRWALENYEAFYWDLDGQYLYLYGKKYKYKCWSIEKHDDRTETVTVMLKKEE